MQEIAQKAVEYGVAGLQELFDMVRNMFGHDEYVIKTSNTWGADARNYINNSLKDLRTTESRLTFYREGPAQQEFDEYMLGLHTASGKIPGIFDDIAALIRNPLSKIIDQHNIVVDLIVAFHDTLTSIVTDIVGIFDGVDIFNVLPSIVDEIQQFKQTLKSKFQEIV